MTTTSETKPTFFQETKPAVIRIWHWLTFLFFAGAMTTVLLNATMFKTKKNISMVQEQVQKEGGMITEKQARSVAHEYSDKLWMVHKYIGFGLSILLLLRIGAEVSILKEKKLSARIQKAMRFPRQTKDRNHYLGAQYSYVLFYVLFLIMALTGLVLAFEDWEWLDPIHQLAKNVHSVVQYGLYAFIVVHLVGVIRADLTQYGGIVSRMINGKNNNTL
jgi:Ni/Fe-hydrogenase 1 B-type cytochrome subunit